MNPIPAAPPSPATPRWHGLWERLSLYLPVLLMGVLALVTYGIVQRIPGPAAAPDTPLAEGQPDYRLEGFILRRYEADGRLGSVLTGAVLEHFPANGLLRVQDATLERIDHAGQMRLLARARELRTDDARTTYHLRGDVRLVREAWPEGERKNATPRLTLEGQTLTWHDDRRLLESDQPVRMTRGADTLIGNRLWYDERNGIADLQGQVRATLVARPARNQ
ncbi:LPS export ABC transporter periplasmic protein LptC [Tepidimonas fonticaldi]|uniref:LPS export ABC transporter periplasmic protein LptC n=1 Tax=Tepidimonas fonticaldi TaxID=1101373 RepID=A0A1A6DXX0_9BURK|nr:LPS export ABC transporter periplasmic protein LptC [Tepidimonas fonticaldi]OBS31693.1 LPS export ABC transporter periplasmic protein LptC [Tepidimonas fonticaldi]